MLYFHLCLLLLLYMVQRMSVLSSSLFVLTPVLPLFSVLLHCAVSWINKQTKQPNKDHNGQQEHFTQILAIS